MPAELGVLNCKKIEYINGVYDITKANKLFSIHFNYFMSTLF